MPTGNLKGFFELSNVLMGDLQLCIGYKCKWQMGLYCRESRKMNKSGGVRAKTVTHVQCKGCLWSNADLKSIWQRLQPPVSQREQLTQKQDYSNYRRQKRCAYDNWKRCLTTENVWCPLTHTEKPVCIREQRWPRLLLTGSASPTYMEQMCSFYK